MYRQVDKPSSLVFLDGAREEERLSVMCRKSVFETSEGWQVFSPERPRFSKHDYVESCRIIARRSEPVLQNGVNIPPIGSRANSVLTRGSVVEPIVLLTLSPVLSADCPW